MKSKKQLLRAKADQLWQEAVKRIHGENCEVCGSDYRVAGHHFYRKSSHGHLRYDTENGVRLCFSCHRRLHDGATEIVDKIEIIRGKKWRTKMLKKSRERIKSSYQTIFYYQSIIKMLK